MKNLSLLILLVATLVGCSHNNPNKGDNTPNPSSGWVNFQDSLYTATTTLDTAKIPVALHAPVYENGLTVKASATIIGGSADGTSIGPLTAHFEPQEITEDPNTAQSFFTFPIDKSLGDYDVQLELISTSHPKVSIGIGNGSLIKVSTLNLCGTLSGTYNGVAQGSGQTVNFQTTVSFNGQLSEEDDFCVYESPSLWGDFVNQLTGDPSFDFPYPANLAYNSTDNSIEVVPAGSNSNPGGSGTYDPSTGVIHLTLQQNLFQDSFTVDVTLTPVQ